MAGKVLSILVSTIIALGLIAISSNQEIPLEEVLVICMMGMGFIGLLLAYGLKIEEIEN